MSYTHDVFLSYPHWYSDWVQECFVPELQRCLAEELNPPAVDIFVDRTGIRTGDAWRERIKREVTLSRSVVAIWSPRYFHSEWCRFESSIVLYREFELGYRTLAKPEGLLFPVRVFDGDHFPDFAKDMQYFDCRDYARRPEVFKASQRYLEFQDRMIDWVSQLGAAIRAAPEWNPDWITEAWLEKAMAYRPEEPPVEFSAPLLH